MANIISIAASKVQFALQQISSGGVPATTPLLLPPDASDMTEFRQITSVNFYPSLSRIPSDGIETTMLVPNSFNPTAEEIERLQGQEKHSGLKEYERGKTAVFEELFSPYPLLKTALQSLSFFAEQQAGNLKAGALKAITLTEGKVFEYRGDDPRLNYFEDATFKIRADYAAGVVSADDALKAIANIHECIISLEPQGFELMTEIANQTRQQILAKKAEQKSLENEMRGLRISGQQLASKAAIATGDMSMSAQENPYQESIDSAQIQLGLVNRQLEALNKEMGGLAGTMVLRNTMFGLAGGKGESELLLEAGSLMARYDLRKDAYSYFVQAGEIAHKVGDRLAYAHAELNKITIDPDTKDEQKVEGLYLFAASLDVVIKDDAAETLKIFDESGILFSREDKEKIRSEVKQVFLAIKAQALCDLMDLVAANVGKDVEDERFVKALKMLDEEIKAASVDLGVGPDRVANLIAAAHKSIAPFAANAAEKVVSLDLEERKTVVDTVMKRASQVEALYAHLGEVDEKGIENTALSETYGAFGAAVYFHLPQQTGYSYSAVLNVFKKYVPTYPESQAKNEIVDHIKKSAPHLFDDNGVYLRPVNHPFAADGEAAANEVYKLNILPTPLWGIGTSLGGSLIFATGLAKLGTVIGAAGGPGGAAAGFSIGSVVGCGIGSLSGTAVVKAVYSAEIDELANEANKSGLLLSGHKKGEGDFNVAMAGAFVALDLAFAKSMGKSLAAFGGKVAGRFNGEALEYYWKDLIVGEGSKARRWFPAIGNGVKGLFLAGKAVDDKVLYQGAEQLIGVMSVGKMKKGQVVSTVLSLVDEARNNMVQNLRMFLGPQGDEAAERVADSLAERLLPRTLDLTVNGSGYTMAERVSQYITAVAKRAKASQSFLEKNTGKETNLATFRRKLAKHLGLQEDDEIVRKVADRIYFRPAEEKSVIASVNLRKDTAGQLGNIISSQKNGMNILVEPESLLNVVRKSLGEVEPSALEDLLSPIGRLSSNQMLKLGELVAREGDRGIKLERLLKHLVRGKDNARELLKGMLGSKSREEIEREIAGNVSGLGKDVVAGLTDEQVGLIVRTKGRVDPHVLEGLITNKEKESLYEAIMYMVSPDQSQRSGVIRQFLPREEVFAPLRAVPGFTEFAAGLGVEDTASYEGRRQFLRSLYKDKEACKRLVGLMLEDPSKSLARQASTSTLSATEKLAQAKGIRDAQKKFFDMLVTQVESAEEEGIKSTCKTLQHTMKDVLRDRMHNWQLKGLSSIADVVVREDRKTMRRALSHAITMSEEGVDGEQHFLGDIINNLAPWHKRKYGITAGYKYTSQTEKTAAEALDAETRSIADRAVESLRGETLDTLRGQLVGSMKYSPESGYLDPIVRPFNKLYDLLANPVDKVLSGRLENLALYIRAADPSMTVRRDPLLWRNRMLEQLYLMKKGKVAGAGDKLTGISGKFVSFMEKAHNFMSKKVATEELRLAHRICLPIAAVDYAADEKLSQVGLVCALFGGNYYAQRAGLSTTYALFFALANKVAGTSYSLSRADSDDAFDVQRISATYLEMGAAMVAQGFLQNGLAFADRTPYGQVIGQFPVVRRLLNMVSLNNPLFKGLYNGSYMKPVFAMGMPFWRGFASLGFVTGASMVQSAAIAQFISGKNLMDAEKSDYTMMRVGNYGLNGATANVMGLWVNSVLEAKNPNADIRSATRQLVERTIGVFTQIAASQFFDVFAGKGDWNSKQNRLLDGAIAGDKEMAESAWQLFEDRAFMDMVGVWDRARDNLNLTNEKEPVKREYGLHVWEKSFHPKQLKSWYTESEMEFSDKKKHQGYLVELAKQDGQKRLHAFLTAFHGQLDNPSAKWREGTFESQREGSARALYHMSLMVKYYANKATRENKPEYQVFADFVAASPYKKFWSYIPDAKDEGELQTNLIRMEDSRVVGESLNEKGEEDHIKLDDLMATVKVDRFQGRFP